MGRWVVVVTGCQPGAHPWSLVWCTLVCGVTPGPPDCVESSMELEEMKGSHSSHTASSSPLMSLLLFSARPQTDLTSSQALGCPRSQVMPWSAPPPRPHPVGIRFFLLTLVKRVTAGPVSLLASKRVALPTLIIFVLMGF